MDPAEAEQARMWQRQNSTAEQQTIEMLQAENARLQSDEPGTPLGRLKGIGDYAVKAGLCSGAEAKPAELFLIESHARLQAALESIGTICANWPDGGREVITAIDDRASRGLAEDHGYRRIAQLRKALANEDHGLQLREVDPKAVRKALAK